MMELRELRGGKGEKGGGKGEKRGGGSFWEELNYHNTLCSNNLIIMIFKKNTNTLILEISFLKEKMFINLKLFQINFIKIVFVYNISD